MDEDLEHIIRRVLEEARAAGRDNFAWICLWAVGGVAVFLFERVWGG